METEKLPIPTKKDKVSPLWLIVLSLGTILLVILIVLSQPKCKNEINLEPGVNYIIQNNATNIGIMNIQTNILRLDSQKLIEMFETKIAPEMNLSLDNLIEIKIIGSNTPLSFKNDSEIPESIKKIKVTKEKKLCLDQYEEK